MYERVIYYSKNDNCWIAEIPELAGCQADGANPYDAMKNAEIVIQEWIETAASIDRVIPEPQGRVSIL